MRSLRQNWRRLLVGLLLVLIIGAAGFVVWASTPTGALLPAAQAALTPDAEANVQHESWLVFTPTDSQPTTGLIFYPGGKVLAEAYAPTAHRLADEGYLVVIVPMPLNLAIFDVNAADRVIAAYPDIQHWAIGGHSLGGAMAANYVKSHPDAVDGLVFWAAYPQASDTLADRDTLQVTSIYGTRDGLATLEKIDAARPFLPASTVYVPIEGGNHAYFGWYGEQPGDNAADISREEQQQQVFDATLQLLQRVSEVS